MGPTLTQQRVKTIGGGNNNFSCFKLIFLLSFDINDLVNCKSIKYIEHGSYWQLHMYDILTVSFTYTENVLLTACQTPQTNSRVNVIRSYMPLSYEGKRSQWCAQRLVHNGEALCVFVSL